MAPPGGVAAQQHPRPQIPGAGATPESVSTLCLMTLQNRDHGKTLHVGTPTQPGCLVQPCTWPFSVVQGTAPLTLLEDATSRSMEQLQDTITALIAQLKVCVSVCRCFLAGEPQLVI